MRTFGNSFVRNLDIVLGEEEPPWHDADDLVGTCVEVDRTTDDFRIAAIAALPCAVADDDDVACRSRRAESLVRGLEAPSPQGSDAEDVEEILSDPAHGYGWLVLGRHRGRRQIWRDSRARRKPY